MKKSIKIIIFLWSFMSIVIVLILLFFESKKIIDYFFGDYHESKMHVYKVDDTSYSRKRGLMVKGRTLEGDVYFVLDGTDEIDFFTYYNEIPLDEKKNVELKNFNALNLMIPIVKFKSSDNVLLIKKGNTFEKTITQWLNPKIILLIIALLPVLLYPIIKKYL